MSAPPVDFTASTSASGFEDGFGRRVLAFDREDGSMRERLYLRPEFSIYQHALRDAFGQVTAAADPRLVAPRVLERDAVTGELVAISDFSRGERLADLLDAASEHARDEGAVPGIEVALGFLLAVLPALDALQSAGRLPHGALAPSRCVLTPDGRVVLTECGFAAVLQRLNLTRQRLWREFRIAVPPSLGATRFDSAGDAAQATLVAVMLVLGRPMQDHDDPADTLPDLLAEVVEIAQIRSNVTFAINLQRFLQRALPLPGRRPYQSIDAALHDVHQLASLIGIELCVASLADFVRGTSGTPAAARAGRVDHVSIAAVRAEAVSMKPPARVESGPQPFTEEVEIDLSPVLEEPAALISEPPIDAVIEPVFDRVFESAPDPVIAPALDPVFEPASEPLVEPVVEPAAEAEYGGAEEDSWPPPAPIEAPLAAMVEEFRSAFLDNPQPAVEATEAIAEPAPHVAPPARRRRSRSRRHDDDALRSSVASAPPPEPVAEPVRALVPAPAAAAPIVEVPAPQPAVVPMPVFSQQMPAPMPTFAPLPAPRTEALWEVHHTIAPPVDLAPQPPAPAPVALAPVRLKNDTLGFKAPPPRRAPRDDHYGGYVEPRRPATTSGPRIPWKFAAAAAAIMVTVLAAGRAYLPNSDTLKAEAKGGPAPVTVAAPSPVTTGTIVVQTQPAGARVLLDGSPAGETPLRIVDVAPGKHVLTFVTPSATIKRTVKVEADKVLTVDVPVFSGWVAIFAPILLEVSQEGRALGTTEQGRLMLPPGRHTLTLTNREFGYSASHAVDIEAGEVRSLNVQPTGTVNLNAVPWAEVWIDGKKAGDTPLANLALPLGNREIIFRHPEFGERRMMTTVTAGAPAAVSVDFSK